MKVIIINGSPKPDGNTATALHEAERVLQQQGTPVYFASPNGTLLSLLDRLFYSNLHTDWSMKVGASVCIARRGGGHDYNGCSQ